MFLYTTGGEYGKVGFYEATCIDCLGFRHTARFTNQCHSSLVFAIAAMADCKLRCMTWNGIGLNNLVKANLLSDIRLV